MKCMLLYLEVMGELEEVHCFKLPPPFRPYFLMLVVYILSRGGRKLLH